ncbi:MAG: Nif3-like dinuclear metal center hexameric protein [Lachnospiraceae bacterium]|nr:Nif3-like dinuclear metal center hexameric protein [Lachnospiraceae bacterium]
MKSQELIGILEELSPVKYALDWDNVGLLCGRREREVSTVYIALDATDEVVSAAVRQKADFLLTHHPLLFRAVKSVTEDDFIGRRLITLIRNDISYYAMHTNFDVMGMADAAAEVLGLRDTEVLDVTFEEEGSKEGIGRVGRLPRVFSVAELCSYVKNRFNLEHARVYGDPESNVEIAAICPGSGKSEIRKALKAGAEVLVTGDIEHHEGIDAVAEGLVIIDAGHYGIEKLFIDYMKDYISENCKDLTILTHPLAEPFWIG